MPRIQRIAPCLWFNDQAEAAATFYTGIFPGSRVHAVSRYGEAGHEFHQRPPGSVLAVAFELDGQPFTALNGGPRFQFTEAISLQVLCDRQGELDTYWAQLAAGGDARALQCGWLKDRYGLSWQVVPATLQAMMADPDATKTERVMRALLPMKKLDIAALQKAFTG